MLFFYIILFSIQNFIDRDLICHVSRSKEHPFIYGFYLYYIVSTNEKDNCKSKVIINSYFI